MLADKSGLVDNTTTKIYENDANNTLATKLVETLMSDFKQIVGDIVSDKDKLNALRDKMLETFEPAEMKDLILNMMSEIETKLSKVEYLSNNIDIIVSQQTRILDSIRKISNKLETLDNRIEEVEDGLDEWKNNIEGMIMDNLSINQHTETSGDS